MDVAPALLTAVVTVLLAAAAMWKGEWLHDAEGRLDPNGYHAGLLAAAGLGGLAAGAEAGMVGGLAIVVAAGNVVFGLLLAWGIGGGDGEPRNVMVGLLGVGVFVTVLIAFATALDTAGSEPGTRALVLLSAPAGLVLLSVPATGEREWVRPGLLSTAVLAAPAVLVGLAAP